MAEPTIEQARESMSRFAADMTTSHKEAAGLYGAFSRFSTLVLPGLLEAGALLKNTSLGRAASNVIDSLTHSTSSLELALQRQYKELRKLRDEGDITAELYEHRLQLLQQQAHVLEAQKNVELASLDLGQFRLTTLKLTVIEMGKLWLMQRQINQAAIEANSNMGDRYNLVQKTFKVMQMTGASIQEATAITRALTRYGFENSQNFEKVAQQVHMLNEGLGMSVDMASQLAVIAESRLQVSFERVGDMIATIVNNTSLAADEAGRLSLNLSSILTTLGPAVDSQMFPQVAQLIGEYEGALKSLGGQVGTVEQFLGRLTRPEGLAAGGALGVMSPEFIATEQGAELVLERFASYADQFIGQASGWDRRMRLDALGDLFGMNAEQAQLLISAIEKRHEQQGQSISLEDRYREQLHATNDAIGRVYNALTSLVHQALYPVMAVLSFGVNLLADIVQFIASNSATATVAIAAVYGAVAYAVLSMGSLVRALWSVIATSRIATAVEAQLAAARAGGAGAGGVSAAARLLPTLGPMLARGFGMLLGPVGIVAAAATGIWMMLERWKKEWADIEVQARLGANKVSSNLEKSYTALISYASRTGDRAEMEHVMSRFKENLPTMIPGYKDMSIVGRRKAEQEVIDRMMLTAELSEQGRRLTYTKIGDKEREADKVSQELQKKLLQVNEEQKKVYEEDLRARKWAVEENKAATRSSRLQFLNRGNNFIQWGGY